MAYYMLGNACFVFASLLFYAWYGLSYGNVHYCKDVFGKRLFVVDFLRNKNQHW